MKITYPLPPNLPEQLPLLTNCQLEDEAILENHLYQQIDLSNQEVRNLVFRDAVFDHLSLANGQFASLIVVMCVLKLAIFLTSNGCLAVFIE